MKRTIISLVTVVMLVMMMLPTDIAMARGQGWNNQTATNGTFSNSSPKSFLKSPLVAGFIFYIPVCSSCSGITFTDKSSGGVKPYKYNWDFGDGSNSTQQNPRHRYASDGTYNVTLTVTDRAGDVASKSQTVTLAPKTNVPLDSGISPNSFLKSLPKSPLVADFIFYIPACSSCSGITFTDKSADGVKPYKYNWDFGDGSNSTQQNPRHRYASAGNYTVTLTVTDKAGDVASTNKTVTLNPAPKVNVEPDGGVLVLPPTNSSLVLAASSDPSSGPNNGGTFANDSTVGTVDWSSPSNAQTQNDVYATASLTSSARTSHYLKATNFGFSIASNATIQGIVVEVDRYESGGSTLRVTDNSIKLVKGGVISGNDKSAGLSWPNSDTNTYVSYGGPSDLWGLNWTPADINSSNFGVVISAIKDSTDHDRTAYVDHIRITVYYAATQPPPSNPPHLDVAKSASPNPNCGAATVTLTVTGAGEPSGERLPVDVILIIDRSGSMGSGGKMTAAKAAAKAFIDLLDPSQDRVGLVSYSDSATLNQGLTTDFAAAKTATDGLSTGGYTDIGDAIKTANTEFTNHGRSPGVVWVEILLTDGLPNRPYGTSSSFTESDAEYARGFAQAAHNAGITLYTIGLGASTDPSNGISYYFLDDKSASGHTYRPGDPAGDNYPHNGLAYIGGGHFYPAPTPADLQFMFEQISQQISSIAGTNVVVTEVLPSGVDYVSGSAVPAPDSIASQTLTWNLGSISIGDTKTITFNVTFDNAGYQLVDVYPDTRVNYTNYLGNSVSKEFPETHVRVLQPVAEAGADVTINSGQSTELDGSGSAINGGCTAAGGHIDYQWRIKGGAVIQSWSTDPTVTVSPTGNTTYTLEVRCSALPSCTDSDDVVVTVTECVPPTADFSGNVTSGCEPLTVLFTDSSTNATSWNWTFPGGSPSSANTKGPHTVTYNSPGTYNVTLTVNNACGNSTTTKVNYIEVLPLPKADFYASNTKPCAGTEIDFIDNSTGTYDEWFWDFGDGSNSTAQDPSHTYATAGTYTVSLTISNGCGSDTKTKENYIEVLPLPKADFYASNTKPCAGTEIDFTDNSTGTYDEWFWDFGDGSNSTAQDPSHTYATAGTYTVSLTISNGCGSDTKTKENYIEVLPLPKADFYASNTQPCAGTEIDFTDNSTGTYDEWFWDFGDGSNSTAQDPSHTYATAGTYTVSLTISNGCGSDTKTKENYIEVLPLPKADFYASNTQPCAGTEIDFTDNSTGTYDEWFWDFGDGSNSTAQDPSHTYATAGTYTVSLIISNGCGSDTKTKENYIEVLPLPKADFYASNTQPCAGTEITFTDNSTGTYDEWFWDFGDGSNSTAQDPSHTYATAGTYTVSLTISNGCGSDTKTKENYIEVLPLPKADFYASNTQPCAGTEIDFTDNSTGTYDEWFWDFGDGSNSTAQDPSHTYATAGTYTVSLTISNGCGSDTKTKENYIEVLPLPKADFYASNTQPCAGTEIDFTDNSTGTYDEWFWDFGDGSNSTAQDPSHTYATAGTYTVSLTISNGCGSDTKTKENYITVQPSPIANFSADQTSGCTPLTVVFTDLSTGNPTSWSWTFGDGGTSNLQNPSHTYTTPGTYTVSLTVSNGCGENTETKTGYITAENCAPVTPAVGGGGCPSIKYLTVDWEGTNTTKPLYSNDRLAVDLLGPSPDGGDSLLLGRGTHAPIVDARTYYRIVIRTLEEIPALPVNTVAIVVFNITPAGAAFDRDILLTLGLNQTQLPANVSNVTMAYYDDVNGVWVPLEYEAGNNTVAELTLSAPINHFSIYGVLAKLSPAPTPPAHFAASGLSIVPSVEKTTFVTKTGETVTITANIANDGGQSGTYAVELKLNGKTVDTKTVILGAGQSQQVSFIRSGLDYGQYEVNVAGLSGTFTASRTINWWLIVGIIVAIGLIIWGVVWGIRRRRKARQEA